MTAAPARHAARFWHARGLAARLLLAQSVVAIVGAATVAAVAAAVGPALFRSHLHQAAGGVHADTSSHVEQAYRSASAVSVGVALLVSLAAAIAVAVFVSRRLAGPVVRLATAAHAVANGRYDVRVHVPTIGPEFASLTESFNAMADRLESTETTRRRLLADLAHEVRTPVATLDGYLEGLEDGVVHIDAETLAMLRTQTARLTRLAEDISAVSRAEEHQLDLHLGPVAANEVVEQAVDACRERYASRRVRLVADVAPVLPTLYADRERLGQVLANLLDNALRHSDPDGTVTVSAGAVGAVLRLDVIDTGDGIPVEQLPHVFERFYRVDRARDRAHGGSGIGLAIVKALVQAHGGEVTASSPGAGRGATFTITLPTCGR